MPDDGQTGSTTQPTETTAPAPQTAAPEPQAEETQTAEPPRVSLGSNDGDNIGTSDDGQALVDRLLADEAAIADDIDSEGTPAGAEPSPGESEPQGEPAPTEAQPTEPPAPEPAPQPTVVPTPEQPVAQPATPQEQPAVQTPPVQQPEVPQQQPAQTPEAQPAQPPQAPEQAPAQPPTEPAQPQLTAEQIAEQQKAQREDMEKKLASHFQVSGDLVDELATEPEKALPKIMAKLYLDAVEGAVGAIQEHLPRVVNSVMEQNQQHQANERAFAERWPQINLNDLTHRDTVLRFAQAYRAVNPQASNEQFIRDVGAQALVALQLPVQPAAPQPAGQGQVVQPPAAPPAPPPHQPVGGGAPAPIGPTVPANIFDQLAQQDEELDRNLDLDVA